MSSPKESREPEFLALNHRGKIPAFVDHVVARDGNPTSAPIIVNESLAILRYIETYHGTDVPLLPPVGNRATRALVLSRIQESENLHSTYETLEDPHFEEGPNTAPLSDENRAELVRAVHTELDFWEVYASRRSLLLGIASVSLTAHSSRFWPT